MGILPQVGTIILLVCLAGNVNSYTKYGRGCNDIGCRPDENCVMAHDSCSYGQRDGKECGSYPTCQRKTGISSQSAGASLNPAPQNTRLSQSSNSKPSQISNTHNSYNPNPTPVNPNYVFGTRQNQPIYPDVPIFPHYQPTSPPPFYQFPQANHPQLPQHTQYIPPQNPYNPSLVFGAQPNFHYPQATTKEPNLLHQFLYNKQDKGKSSVGQTHLNFMVSIISVLIFILTNRFT